MINKLNKVLILSWALLFLAMPIFVSAHRSGCHRWHSCPSDTGSYVCGDLGHPCTYPTYPKSGGVILPESVATLPQQPHKKTSETARQKRITVLKKQISDLRLKLQQLESQLKALEQ
ncbi:MAG: hypothetical protein AAB581_00510 [Patescibacteria group bacterium]